MTLKKSILKKFKPGPAFALAALVLLAACSQPNLPEDHFYRLVVTPPQGKVATKLTSVVEVNRFIADGLTAGRPIVFTKPGQSHEVQAYHYHFWTEPPTIMLQKSMASYLRQASTAAKVVTPELRIEPNFVVHGKIVRFEQITGGSGQVSVELELSLTDNGTEKLIHQKNYRLEVPTGNLTVPAAVKAIGGAVSRIYAGFLNDIR